VTQTAAIPDSVNSKQVAVQTSKMLIVGNHAVRVAQPNLGNAVVGELRSLAANGDDGPSPQKAQPHNRMLWSISGHVFSGGLEFRVLTSGVGPCNSCVIGGRSLPVLEFAHGRSIGEGLISTPEPVCEIQ